MAPNTNPDEVLETLAPRLTAAKRAYLRKRLAALFAIPLVLVATAAWGAIEPGGQISEVATAPGESGSDSPGEPTVTADPVADPTVAPLPEWQTVPLGVLGKIQVRVAEAGIELGETELIEGWTARILESADQRLLLVLEHEDLRIRVDVSVVDDELVVHFDDVTPHEEPTTPAVGDREEIAVGDYGKVVVERDGEVLVLAVTWSHQWWEPRVVVERGSVVHAYFANDGYEKHVKAWIDGTKIVHEISLVAPEPEPEPEIQTRKEIGVYDVATVVVEREGDGNQLWLGVTWTHEWYDAIVVTEHGELVHAFFTNDGYEKHVKAWTDGPKIRYETWIVEPEVESYTGTVVCEFGSIDVVVEGDIARITGVSAAEGVTASVLVEVGEMVKVEYVTESEVWHVVAWGNGHEVLHEAHLVE